MQKDNIIRVKSLKNHFKFIRTIRNFYNNWFVFIKTIPPQEFLKIKKLKLLFKVKPYTMLSYSRLSALYNIAIYLERENVDGRFVECGVWNGGSAGVIAAVSKYNKNRHIWLFDSWEGLSSPSKWDISYKGLLAWRGMALGYKEKAEELLFKKLRLNNKRVYLIKGWFNETIPLYKKEINKIALLHLDCDLYESVKFCLNELYESVIENGFIIIDDYGHWEGCKKAVDEFIQQRGLKIELNKIDYTGVYFQKKIKK